MLFGGHHKLGSGGTEVLDGTWEWDGSNWTQLCGAGTECVGPAARRDTRMVYDEVRQVFVLYGGVDGAGEYFDDLWEWGPRCP